VSCSKEKKKKGKKEKEEKRKRRNENFIVQQREVHFAKKKNKQNQCQGKILARAKKP